MFWEYIFQRNRDRNMDRNRDRNRYKKCLCMDMDLILQQGTRTNVRETGKGPNLE